MSGHNHPNAGNIRHGNGQGGQAPSVQATQAARKEFEITDSAGRKIVLRKPSVLAQYDVIGMIDDKRPGAGAQRMMAGILLYVASVDGEEVPPPTTERELRAIFQKLGDEGYMAIATGIEMYFPATEKDQKREGALKNS